MSLLAIISNIRPLFGNFAAHCETSGFSPEMSHLLKTLEIIFLWGFLHRSNNLFISYFITRHSVVIKAHIHFSIHFNHFFYVIMSLRCIRYSLCLFLLQIYIAHSQSLVLFYFYASQDFLKSSFYFRLLTVVKLDVHPLLDAVNNIVLLLFMIFLAINKSSTLPFLSEWVNDAHRIAEIHRRWAAFLAVCGMNLLRKHTRFRKLNSLFLYAMT